MVKIRDGDKVDTVMIMPRKRVDLPPGYEVDNNWNALNPRVIRIGEDK